MRRALILSLALIACGPPPKPPPTLQSFFPADNEVGTFVEDTSAGQPGVEVARTPRDTEALVDGDAAPFIEKGMQAFAWQRYVKGSYKLDARVWQMKSSANAQETYDHLVANVSLYSANTWTALAIGEAGRIADTGSSWWVNAKKGVYLLEVKVNPKDDTSRSDVEAFAKASAAKMP